MKELKEYIITENNFFKNLGIGQEKLIKDWLEKYCEMKGKYTINPDMTIDAVLEVKILNYPEKEFPEYIQFGKVPIFEINRATQLISLRGCPKQCDLFQVRYCTSLETLEHCPKVCMNFSCEGCKKLKSLENSPVVERDFCCSGCDSLKNLEGVKFNSMINPRIFELNCNRCEGLETLEGCPKVLLTLSCNSCTNLKSLKGAPQRIIHRIDCRGCKQLDTLEGLKIVDGQILAWGCGKKFMPSDLQQWGIVTSNGKKPILKNTPSI